jgi:hypothetical protein
VIDFEETKLEALYEFSFVVCGEISAEDLVNIFVVIGLEEKSLNPINLLTSAEIKQRG